MTLGLATASDAHDADQWLRDLFGFLRVWSVGGTNAVWSGDVGQYIGICGCEKCCRATAVFLSHSQRRIDKP